VTIGTEFISGINAISIGFIATVVISARGKQRGEKHNCNFLKKQLKLAKNTVF